ncbi:hypothetical protein [Promicromonospora sp. MEB111]|uniref:hypothetical protein n=1 Tax=Promicromonospora sp. MEB111 TaxID=3040301 RepID=UPI00254A4DE3|nr:hypothetical protein [Promicromonospora sp. MEB111]
METSELFARELANTFASFRDQLEGYLDDGNDGFAYVFLAVEVTPELLAAYNASEAGEFVELDWRALLAFLDGWFIRGDPDVDNVIKASFLLQLPGPEQQGSEIVEELPEGLRLGLESVRGGR